MFQQNIVVNDKLSEDAKNYLLATSEFGQEIQSYVYARKGKLNDASFSQKLDPIMKNVIRNENSLELVSKDVSKFDAQNPVINSLIREIDIRKKDVLSKLL